MAKTERRSACCLLACLLARCLLACWLDLRGEGCSNIHIHTYIYYYTPLPLNLANKQASKHFSFPFWPLLRLIAPGSTLL